MSYDGVDGAAELELELSVWRGEIESARAVLATFHQVPECDLDELGLDTDLQVLDLERPGLDDSLVLVGTTTFGESSATIVLAMARVEGTLVVVYLGALEGELEGGPDRARRHAVAAIDLVLDRL